MTVICMCVSFDDEELGLLQQTMPWTFLLWFFFLLIYTNISKTEHQEIGIIFFCLKFAYGFKTRF